MRSWEHQVELKLDPRAAAERLRRVQSWCGDWQLGFRVIDTLGAGMVHIAFENPRFARAFQSDFGGVPVPLDETGKAMGADAAAEDAYDRLARAHDLED